MNRQRLNSSFIRSAGYEPDKELMEIEFVRGHVFEYHRVDQRTFDGLMLAESAGSYFHRHIKGKFAFQEVK